MNPKGASLASADKFLWAKASRSLPRPVQCAMTQRLHLSTARYCCPTSPGETILGPQESLPPRGEAFPKEQAIQLEGNSWQYSRVGEPTEAALKVLVEKLGVPNTLPPSNPSQAACYYGRIRSVGWEKLATLEFSRVRKSMSVLCRSAKTAKNSLFVKGAPEGMLPR